MSRALPRVIAFLLCLYAPALLAEGAKFLPAAPGAASGRYRVIVDILPGDHLPALSQQLAATYRGRVEPEASAEAFVIEMTESGARLLSTDPRVLLVEEISASPIPAVPAAARDLAGTETGSTWSTGQYLYDGSGNVRKIGSGAFVYDGLGRLVSGTVASQRKQEYSYDAFGNIKTIDTTEPGVPVDQKVLGVNPQNNRIDKTTPRHNVFGTYTDSGNLTTDSGGGSYVYDGVDMVKESTFGTARTLYLYGADDERVASVRMTGTSPGSSDWTLRDGGGRVLRRFTRAANGSWSWVEDYIYRGDALLAAEVNTPQRTLHFHLDHLGTPRLITGSGGAEIGRHTYFAFGQETFVEPAEDAELRKFTGHERDDINLDYMHARFYKPFWGRFLSVDPTWDSADLGRPQTWNRYAYVTNDPIRHTDPDGKVGIDPVELGKAIWATAAEFTTTYVADAPSVDLSADLPKDAAQRAQYLTQRAKEIHGVVAEGTQKRTTIATGQVRNPDGSRQVLVASSEKNLRPTQRAALKSSETAVSGVGHAEQTLINAAKANGQVVEEVAASRGICPACNSAIKNVGAKAVSALKAVFKHLL